MHGQQDNPKDANNLKSVNKPSANQLPEAVLS
jgi:hypothetical protein